MKDAEHVGKDKQHDQDAAAASMVPLRKNYRCSTFHGSWPGPRVGSRGVQHLAGRAGLGQGGFGKLTGRIWSGQEVFKSHGSGSGRPDPIRPEGSDPIGAGVLPLLNLLVCQHSVHQDFNLLGGLITSRQNI